MSQPSMDRSQLLRGVLDAAVLYLVVAARAVFLPGGELRLTLGR